MPRLAGVNWHCFWRGFVSGADVNNGETLRQNAETLFAVAPMQFLRLRALDPVQCVELAECPYLERLYSLDLSGTEPGLAGVRALAGCRALENPRMLKLRRDPRGYTQYGTVDGDQAALALAASPHLNRLTCLDVQNNPLGTEAVRALRRRFGERVVLFASR